MKDIVHRLLKIPHALDVAVDTRHRGDTLTVVFVHGLASSHSMWDPVIARLKSDTTRIISLDLLGFGESPKPLWQTYDARVHAASLRRTLRKLRVVSPVVIVGHSLGALVAVRYASRYPWAVDSLVLCAPPFYEPNDKQTHQAKSLSSLLAQPDDLYLSLYRYSRGRPELAKKLASFVKRARLIGSHFTVDDATLPAIVSSLEMSIENQQSLREAKALDTPTYILYGQLDPFVIKRRLKELAAANPSVQLTSIPAAGHEVYRNWPFERRVVQTIEDLKAHLAT